MDIKYIVEVITIPTNASEESEILFCNAYSTQITAINTFNVLVE